jgi:hypothetical protein
MYGRLASLAACAAVLCLAAGCGVSGPGGGGEASGGGGTTSGTTGGTEPGFGTLLACYWYSPDEEACPAAPFEPGGGCMEDIDCCGGRQPLDGVYPALTPSQETPEPVPGCPDDYPNNWTCVGATGSTAGNCEHGGCTDHGDCKLNGFTCEDPIGGPDACVRKCTDDDDCMAARMPGTKCIGVIQGSSDKYCVEDL